MEHSFQNTSNSKHQLNHFLYRNTYKQHNSYPTKSTHVFCIFKHYNIEINNQKLISKKI